MLMANWSLYNKMKSVTQVQILDMVVCISHNANTLVKGMNSTILPLAMKEL